MDCEAIVTFLLMAEEEIFPVFQLLLCFGFGGDICFCFSDGSDTSLYGLFPITAQKNFPAVSFIINVDFFIVVGIWLCITSNDSRVRFLVYLIREELLLQLPHYVLDKLVFGSHQILRDGIVRWVLKQTKMIHQHILDLLRAAYCHF